MDRLYKLVYGTAYFEDLRVIDAAPIINLLSEIQKRRNEFVHGRPDAITNELIENLVSVLKEESISHG